MIAVYFRSEAEKKQIIWYFPLAFKKSVHKEPEVLVCSKLYALCHFFQLQLGSPYPHIYKTRIWYAVRIT